MDRSNIGNPFYETQLAITQVMSPESIPQQSIFAAVVVDVSPVFKDPMNYEGLYATGPDNDNPFIYQRVYVKIVDPDGNAGLDAMIPGPPTFDATMRANFLSGSGAQGSSLPRPTKFKDVRYADGLWTTCQRSLVYSRSKSEEGSWEPEKGDVINVRFGDPFGMRDLEFVSIKETGFGNVPMTGIPLPSSAFNNIGNQLSDGFEEDYELGLTALAVAIENIGQGEVGGNNSGPYVEGVLGMDASTSGGRAWCAGFVSYCFKQAALKLSIELPFRPSTGAKRLYNNVGASGKFVENPMPGDVVTWNRTQDPSRGHVGIVERYDGSNDILHTVEGNVGSWDPATGARAEVRRFAHSDWREGINGFSRDAFSMNLPANIASDEAFTINKQHESDAAYAGTSYATYEDAMTSVSEEYSDLYSSGEWIGESPPDEFIETQLNQAGWNLNGTPIDTSESI